jgi:putative nucleotide binding protein
MHAAIADDDWLVVLGVGTTTPFASAQPPVQAVATTSFALVDVTVTDATDRAQGDRLYVGPGRWERVIEIDRQLTYDDLTPAVQGVLEATVERIITHNERRFIEAFNTTRLDDRDGHPLDLLSSLSADCQDAIIAERSQRRFTDFTDLTTRVACCEQPWDRLVDRVLLELREGKDTYRWLTASSRDSTDRGSTVYT